MNTATSVSRIPFVGPTYAKRLEKLGIYAASDLVHHYPSRYVDLSDIRPILSIQAGEVATVQGRIVTMRNDRTRYNKTIQRARIEDATGVIEVVWFNQPFLVQTLKEGMRLNISGKATQFGAKVSVQSPEYEILTDKKSMHDFGTIHTGRIVPIYPETYGVSSKWLRSRIAYVLSTVVKHMDEFLPDHIVDSYTLASRQVSLLSIHFPDNFTLLEQARKRLSFDELYLTQLASQIRRREWQIEQIGTALSVSRYESEIKKFISSLPFRLTPAQEKSVDEILNDLEKHHPMNRLLQGDVGSGKTVVAAIAAFLVHLNGYSTVIMAPTEILAKQHYDTLKDLFEPYGIGIRLVTGSTKTKHRAKKKSAAEHSNKNSILVGTHALLFNESIANLALVVIDEQHRFGVSQRAKLRSLGVHPHLLSMTATPIPRSVALIVHSELDLSYIDELPRGRKKVKTWLVPNKKRAPAYAWIHKQISTKSESGKRAQAFIVCPLIEESSHETLKSVKSAKAEYDRLRKSVFPTLNVALLHGRMKAREKNSLLADFSSGRYDILVATPVVEVGIDIPNATIILIEAAERFGLSQLHQLRGRVGRSGQQSYCLLFTEASSEKAIQRLKSLESVHNGARLSEIDLTMRGPGDMYGLRQHGFSSFKIARFTDHETIRNAKSAVEWTLLHAPDVGESVKTPFGRLQSELKPYIIQSIHPD